MDDAEMAELDRVHQAYRIVIEQTGANPIRAVLMLRERAEQEGLYLIEIADAVIDGRIRFGD